MILEPYVFLSIHLLVAKRLVVHHFLLASFSSSIVMEGSIFSFYVAIQNKDHLSQPLLHLCVAM